MHAKCVHRLLLCHLYVLVRCAFILARTSPSALVSVMGRRKAPHRASGTDRSAPIVFAGLAALAAGQSSPSSSAIVASSSSQLEWSSTRAATSSKKRAFTHSSLEQSAPSEQHMDEVQLMKRRSDMTEVRGIRRADPVKAWELSATEAGREAMLRKFDEDVHTGPGHVVRNSQLATWEKIHFRWNPEDPVLPLTWHKIRAVAAHMKSAGYRSWSNYASRIKEEHVLAGHPWTLLLETCFRKAKRSVLRGIGPVVQALPLGIKDVMLVDEMDLLVSADMPINLKDMYVVASFFMLREIEAAALVWRHAQLDLEALTISFMLTISKTDVTAAGCRRCWGCVCVVGPRVVPCPFHSFLAHRNDLLQRGEAWIRPDAPVFPDACGRQVSKASFVAGLRVLGAAVGTKQSKGQGEIGGHSPRVEGAQYLASLGID